MLAFALSRSLIYSLAVIAVCATSLCTCHRFNEMYIASWIISFENTIDLKCLKCAGSDELAGSWAANRAVVLPNAFSVFQGGIDPILVHLVPLEQWICVSIQLHWYYLLSL